MLVPFSMHGNFLSKILVTDKSSICMEHPQVVAAVGDRWDLENSVSSLYVQGGGMLSTLC